jgi:hypothetical protein
MLKTKTRIASQLFGLFPTFADRVIQFSLSLTPSISSLTPTRFSSSRMAESLSEATTPS